jgi:hypothetical protein
LSALCAWKRSSNDSLSSSPELTRSVSNAEVTPLQPKIDDLARLHWICLSRKALTPLEFGSGFSTVVFADALRLLSEAYGNWPIENLRTSTPYLLTSIEEEQRFLETTRARLKPQHLLHVDLIRSSVEIGTHDNRIVTFYSSLPNRASDFIYLDGPSQYANTSEFSGFSFAAPHRMPMAADLLRTEFFLEPGTLILIDGRTANARFLRAYFKRNWAYCHLEEADVHLFELQESPLGRYNARKLELSLPNGWLLG